MKDGTPWWDGYTNQDVILIDDFDGKWPFRDLLRLLDRYPYQGQIKGGYVKINSPHIYITCEFPPADIYQPGNELNQIIRRLDIILQCNENHTISEIDKTYIANINHKLHNVRSAIATRPVSP